MLQPIYVSKRAERKATFVSKTDFFQISALDDISRMSTFWKFWITFMFHDTKYIRKMTKLVKYLSLYKNLLKLSFLQTLVILKNITLNIGQVQGCWCIRKVSLSCNEKNLLNLFKTTILSSLNCVVKKYKIDFSCNIEPF